MITLITGVPGSGKTLRALAEVKALSDKVPGRSIFSGIKRACAVVAGNRAVKVV
ncbi:MAG: hypothetical protein IPN40_10335 [Uliginosibacterium sp.]|nr:hypothetical protein [Uliginosibacterium sp.]